MLLKAGDNFNTFKKDFKSINIIFISNVQNVLYSCILNLKINIQKLKVSFYDLKMKGIIPNLTLFVI